MRFSVTAALVMIVAAALLFHGTLVFQRAVTDQEESRCALSFVSLFFLTMCAVVQRTPLQTLSLTAVFYLWGAIAIWLGDLNLVPWVRYLYIAIGVVYASLAWLKPEPGLLDTRVG